MFGQQRDGNVCLQRNVHEVFFIVIVVFFFFSSSSSSSFYKPSEETFCILKVHNRQFHRHVSYFILFCFLVDASLNLSHGVVIDGLDYDVVLLFASVEGRTYK